MYDYSYFPIIETERLRLRQMTDDDAPAILAEFSHPDVTRHLDLDLAADDLKGALDFIRRANAMYESKQGWRWGITLKSDGTLIGTCGFHRWNQDFRRAEIGYDLRYEFWGNGYATEFVRRMAQFGFKEMNLHRIEADTNEGNTASAHVLEKAGFTYEGLWRDRIIEKGRFVSLKQYAILETDYKNHPLSSMDRLT